MSTAADGDGKPNTADDGRIDPAQPVAPRKMDAQEVLAISSSSVAAAPGWLRRRAKSDSGQVMVHAAEPAGETQAPQTREEALAGLWSRLQPGRSQ